MDWSEYIVSIADRWLASITRLIALIAGQVAGIYYTITIADWLAGIYYNIDCTNFRLSGQNIL